MNGCFPASECSDPPATPPLLLRDTFHRAFFVPLFCTFIRWGRHSKHSSSILVLFMKARADVWGTHPAPPGALFLFLIPTPRDHDQRPPRRIVRIPAAAFAWPAGRRVCVRVCGRKVRGKGRPVYLWGLKWGVVITGARQPVSCCVYIDQHLTQILWTEVFSAFQHRRFIKDRPACARVLRKECMCEYATQPLQISNMYCCNAALQTLTCCLYVPMKKTHGSSIYIKLLGALKVCECERIWGSKMEDNYIKCKFGNNCASVFAYLRCPQWTPPHMFSTGCKLA